MPRLQQSSKENFKFENYVKAKEWLERESNIIYIILKAMFAYLTDFFYVNLT